MKRGGVDPARMPRIMSARSDETTPLAKRRVAGMRPVAGRTGAAQQGLDEGSLRVGILARFVRERDRELAFERVVLTSGVGARANGIAEQQPVVPERAGPGHQMHPV